MKQKTKKQTAHWLKVAVIGITLGFALQFVRAWTEPAVAPPGGNVGAPINTGVNVQTKGEADHDAASDICVWNAGVRKCMSSMSTTTPAPDPIPTPPSCSCGACGDTYTSVLACCPYGECGELGYTLISVYLCTTSGWSCTANCFCPY